MLNPDGLYVAVPPPDTLIVKLLLLFAVIFLGGKNLVISIYIVYLDIFFIFIIYIMGQGKKHRTKLNKERKNERTHEQNIKALEALKQKERLNGFDEWERLPGLNTFLNPDTLPKHFKTLTENK